MSRNVQFWLGSAVIGLAAIAWLADSQWQLSRARLALEALNERNAAFQDETRRLERKMADWEDPARASHGAAGAVDTRRSPGGAPESNSEKNKIGVLLKTPSLQVEFLAARRARLGRVYGSLFKNLKLSPDQIAQFESIAMQREERELDIAGAVPAAMRTSYSGGQWYTGLESFSVGGGGADADVQAAAKLQEQADQAFETAATGLLGADGYEQLRDYERAQPVRPVVDDLAGELATGGNPLNPDQANQVAQLLAGASASYAEGGTVNLGQIDWGQVLQQAQAVLSPPQVSVLAQVVSLRQASGQFHALFQAATRPAGGTSAGP